MSHGGLNDEGTIHVPDGATHQISPATDAVFDLIGWVDSTHLAGYYAPMAPTPTRSPTPTPLSSGSPSGPQTATLAIQDIATGAVHIVFSMTSSSLGLGDFTLAPDGKHALFYNVRQRADPYTPDVRLIDIASGAATKLPHIAQAMGQGGGGTSIAWRAGTLTLAASTGFLVNGDLKTWVLDAQHDVAQALPEQEGAYVGGWVPNSDTPVLTTGLPLSYGYSGPFTLTTIANATSASGTAIPLTADAYHLSFGGFAHTAS